MAAPDSPGRAAAGWRIPDRVSAAATIVRLGQRYGESPSRRRGGPTGSDPERRWSGRRRRLPNRVGGEKGGVPTARWGRRCTVLNTETIGGTRTEQTAPPPWSAYHTDVRLNPPEPGQGRPPSAPQAGVVAYPRSAADLDSP